VNLYQDHYDALDAIATSNPSALAIYQRDVAHADLIQAQKRQTAEATYQQDIWNAVTTELDKELHAEDDLESLTRLTDLQYAQAAAPLAHASAIDMANAEHDLALNN